jgi:hypothetical protein
MKLPLLPLAPRPVCTLSTHKTQPKVLTEPRAATTTITSTDLVAGCTATTKVCAPRQTAAKRRQGGATVSHSSHFLASPCSLSALIVPEFHINSRINHPFVNILSTPQASILFASLTFR